MNDRQNKLLMKIATGDKSITVLGDIAKLNKSAVVNTAYAKRPGLTAMGDVAAAQAADANSMGITQANPSAAQRIDSAATRAGIARGHVKPSYLDVLKQRAGEAWDWTKGQWNQLSPETQKNVGDIGLGFAGAAAGDTLVRLLGGRKNKIMRLLGMISGTGLGIAANRYLQNPDFKNTVNTGFDKLVNKLKA